jgi:transposase
MATPPSHSQAVLPNSRILLLERVERSEQRFRLFVTVNQTPSCPMCGRISRSFHSSYCRCLQDLPWQGLSVQLVVIARRYRCRNPDCPRKVFCERLPGVARVHARQTLRASEIIRLVGYVAGGRPGYRLLARLAITTSDDTVLRRVKQPPIESVELPPIRNLGVDDWAWRKGQNYGTILVDLDLHQVADLLPDRSSESFSSWLQQHPEITTIARDRCGLYAEGASLGAPGAQQVADRFHLVLNLSAAVERVFEERSRELVLPPVAESEALATGASAESAGDQQESPAASPTEQQQRRQRRLARYNQVVELFTQGYSQKAISRQLGMQTKTIRRWLRAGQFPERKPAHRRPAKVSEFADYLQQRWNDGCRNATRLFKEIREKGYAGKRSMVARFVSSWRKTGKPASPEVPQRIAPKHAAILATSAADQMSEQQQTLFDRIVAQCPDAMLLRNLALDFRQALTSSETWRMEAWIEVVKQCQYGPLVRLAYGLQRDIKAVTAAVETSWSTGQVEGQINRLKMIKRQMYGRAGFDLLRARVLPYTSVTTMPFGPAP